MNSYLNDDEIVMAIKEGGQRLEKAMHQLLHKSGWQKGIGQYIKSKSGSREDVEDVFQEGIRHLVINVRADRFGGNSSIKTYLSSICKNLWYTKFSRDRKLDDIKKALPPKEEKTPSPEDTFIINEKSQLLSAVLGQLGDTCKKVLSLWSLGFSFKEISEKTGNSEGAVRKQKFDCLKKLTSLLAAQPALVRELRG